jgi:hypothetical protein
MLDALAKRDGSVRVWRLTNKFEDLVRETVGEGEYQRLCQAYSHHSKPTRQRLIALDGAMPVPDQFGSILNWLGGKAEAG